MAYNWEIFISYSFENPPEEWVKLFKEALEYSLGILSRKEIYYCREKIFVGQQWNSKVKGALSSSKFIIPVFTPTYFDPARFAITELAYMYHRYKKFEKIAPNYTPILPIRLYPEKLFNFELEIYDFEKTLYLPRLTGAEKGKIKNELISKTQELANVIREYHDYVPPWQDSFESPDFFNESLSRVNEVKSIYVNHNDFNDFENPSQTSNTD